MKPTDTRVLLLLLVALAAAPAGAQGMGASGAPRGLRPASAPRTLTLAQAWDLADQESWDLRLAALRLAETEVVIQRAWGAFLPSVSLGGGYTFNFPEQKFAFGSAEQSQQQALLYSSLADITEQSAAMNPDPLAQRAALERAEQLRAVAKDIATAPVKEVSIQPAHSFDAQLSVQLPLIVPRAWPMLHNAYAGVDVARITTRQARAQIRYGVARAYYQAVAAKKLIAIAQGSVDSAARHRDLAKQRVEQGLITDLALQRAELDLARAEQQRRMAAGGLTFAKAALGGTLGITEDFDVAEPPPAAAVAEAEQAERLIERALAARDDVKAQQELLAIAGRNSTEAWLRLLPSIVAVGSGRGTSNTEGLVSQPFSGSLGLQAQIPIFDSGQTWASIAEADARREQEALKLDRVTADVEAEVRGALDDIALKRDALATAQRVVELADQSKANADQLFELGVATSLDVADASLGAFSAQVDAARAALELETARIGLLVALGELLPTDAR